MEKDIHEIGNQKRTSVAIFIWDKIYFNSITVIKDKEGYYIYNAKGSIYQKDIISINIYAPNTGAYKYIK